MSRWNTLLSTNCLDPSILNELEPNKKNTIATTKVVNFFFSDLPHCTARLPYILLLLFSLIHPKLCSKMIFNPIFMAGKRRIEN